MWTILPRSFVSAITLNRFVQMWTSEVEKMLWPANYYWALVSLIQCLFSFCAFELFNFFLLVWKRFFFSPFASIFFYIYEMHSFRLTWLRYFTSGEFALLLNDHWRTWNEPVTERRLPEAAKGEYFSSGLRQTEQRKCYTSGYKCLLQILSSDFCVNRMNYSSAAAFKRQFLLFLIENSR